MYAWHDGGASEPRPAAQGPPTRQQHVLASLDTPDVPTSRAAQPDVERDELRGAMERAAAARQAGAAMGS